MTCIPASPFASASHPPNPNGVGAGRPPIVTWRSARGMLTFSTPSLKSPFLLSDVSTA